MKLSRAYCKLLPSSRSKIGEKVVKFLYKVVNYFHLFRKVIILFLLFQISYQKCEKLLPLKEQSIPVGPPFTGSSEYALIF